MKRIYLDANAASPVLIEAVEKIKELMSTVGNPSSTHEHGRALRAHIDEARALVAKAVGARSKEIIFTSGASEANRLFVDALIEKGKTEGRAQRVLTSPFEHPSLLKPLMHAHARNECVVNIIEIDDGRLIINTDDLHAADVVIACLAHNETGIIPELDKILAAVKPEAIVMSDVAQGFARMMHPPARVDVMSFSAQKIGGIAGVGGLVVRGNAAQLPSPWHGGGQERGFRPGTESSWLIASLGAAASVVERERALHKNLEPLRDYLESKLLEKAPIKIIGKDLPRLANTSAVSFYKENADALRIACDVAGLSVGFGAACSGLAPVPSFALTRLGLTREEEKTTIRFSLTRDTTREDIDETLERLFTGVLTNC